MLRTLHGKLSLVVFVLMALVGVAWLPLTLLTTRTYNEEVSQKLNRNLASDLAKHLSGQGLLDAKFASDAKMRAAAGAEISHLMVLNPDIEIYVLDSAGTILAASTAPGKVLAEKVSLEPVQQFLTGTGPMPILGDDPRQPGQGKVFSAAAIPAESGRIKGYVYIILGGQERDSAAGSLSRSYTLRLGAWSVAVVLGVTFLVAAVLFTLLTRRLRWLTTEVAALRFGASAQHGGETGAVVARDEIAALEAAFADMSGRIGSQVQKLEQADVNRREAVSNVSHDLRTPLAALQGYLETLLMKEGMLTAEEQRAYLTIALRHAERLGKLVAALFELAKLDSREMQLACEEFSLAELVQDATQQFDLAAKNKGITLGVHCSSSLPFVSADIGLVERALENLIENALRHTPAGGTVDITLDRRDNNALIVVKDSGVGIRPQDLNRIFERSFRAHDTARTEEDDGAGLGLAITRRIAQLHGGDVAVESTIGQGAEFTLTLPLASS